MTSATEKLRRLLDERGVEWTACDGEHVRETCWDYMGELTAAFAEFDNGTTKFACDTWCFTPEQAIVATLGNGVERTRTEYDALTAKQVSKAVERHGNIMDNRLYENWQAVADELNAMLGSGTCKLIDTTSPSNDDYWNSAMCSECGADFTCAIFGSDRRLPDANYCPNCGRKVEHDRDE